METLFSVSLKKVRTILMGQSKTFFSANPARSLKVSNRSRAGKAIVSLTQLNYNYNPLVNTG